MEECLVGEPKKGFQTYKTLKYKLFPCPQFSLLVGELELVPFQLLWCQSVSLDSIQVQDMCTGIFANPNDQNPRSMNFFLGQKYKVIKHNELKLNYS